MNIPWTPTLIALNKKLDEDIADLFTRTVLIDALQEAADDSYVEDDRILYNALVVGFGELVKAGKYPKVNNTVPGGGRVGRCYEWWCVVCDYLPGYSESVLPLKVYDELHFKTSWKLGIWGSKDYHTRLEAEVQAALAYSRLQAKLK